MYIYTSYSKSFHRSLLSMHASARERKKRKEKRSSYSSANENEPVAGVVRVSRECRCARKRVWKEEEEKHEDNRQRPKRREEKIGPHGFCFFPPLCLTAQTRMSSSSLTYVRREKAAGCVARPTNKKVERWMRAREEKKKTGQTVTITTTATTKTALKDNNERRSDGHAHTRARASASKWHSRRSEERERERREQEGEEEKTAHTRERFGG